MTAVAQELEEFLYLLSSTYKSCKERRTKLPVGRKNCTLCNLFSAPMRPSAFYRLYTAITSSDSVDALVLY